MDVREGWRPSGGWGAGERRYAQDAATDVGDKHTKFIVNDTRSLHTWIRYGFEVDTARYPIVVMKYRAQDVADHGWYSLWLDDGTGPAGGGVEVFLLGDLKSDGQIHELRQDLRELEPKGMIRGMALGVMSSESSPAFVELVELRFERSLEQQRLLKSGGLEVVRQLPKTTVWGLIRDPAYEEGKNQLGGRYVATVKRLGAGHIEVRLEQSGGFGGNAIILELRQEDGSFSGRATLPQWTDFGAYNGKLSRKLSAPTGGVNISQFSSDRGSTEVNVGEFELRFDVGTLRGSYHASEVR